MFIPLVELLRCVNPHEETWLVASIERSAERDIVTGTLGCPICRAEYPIRDGVVLFDPSTPVPSSAPTPSESGAVRAAAALDLTDARMTALLHGGWGVYAPMIRGLTPAQLLLINPPPGITSGDGISIVRSTGIAPVARGSMAGAAIGDNAPASMLESLVSSVRSGGRVMGSVGLPVPAGLAELARDADVWVARRDAAAAASAPVTLTRRSR